MSTHRNWRTWRVINVPRRRDLARRDLPASNLSREVHGQFVSSSRTAETTTSSPATNSIKAESHACCVTFLLPTTNRTNYSPDHVPAPTRQRPTLMEQIIWIIAQKASTVSTLSGLGFHNFSWSSRGPWKSIGGASKSGKRISAPEDWTPLSVSCSFGGGGAGRQSAVECYCSGRWQLTVQWDDRRIGGDG